MRKLNRHHRAGCPPSGSVMVETGDPPPGRGQPATQHFMEDQQHIKPNCKSVRPTGSTSDSDGGVGRHSPIAKDRVRHNLSTAHDLDRKQNPVATDSNTYNWKADSLRKGRVPGTELAPLHFNFSSANNVSRSLK